MHVVVGSASFDVSSRALVIGVLDPALAGDDLVAAAHRMVIAGADAIEVDGAGAVECVRAAVDVPVAAPGAVGSAITDDAATMAVAIVGGARLVRTKDIRTARRVADVLAAVIDAAGTPAR